MPDIKNNLKKIALSWAICVSIGALGAHFMKKHLPESSLDSFLVGNRYHFYINISILLLLLLQVNLKSVNLKRVINFQWIGLFLFSGSIYLLSTIPLHGMEWVKKLGIITPIGGLIYILSWIFLFIEVSKSTNRE
jgi:uncharacterized membrane protein YgdD (TMEM256/DUF423 family)